MDKYIFEYRNAVPEDLCKRIIEKFENDDRKADGKVVGTFVTKYFKNNKSGDDTAVMKSMKDSTDLSISGLDGWEQIDSELSKYIGEISYKYFDYLKSNFVYDQTVHALEPYIDFGKMIDNGYLLQRISKGSRYNWHSDGDMTGNGMFAAIILYLNTLDYDEGGCTELVSGRMIRPECGKVLIFPATWTFVHRGNVVLGENSKYICSSNIHIFPH